LNKVKTNYGSSTKFISERQITMTKSMKSLMVGAALAGIVAGNKAFAQNTNPTRSFSSISKGLIAADQPKEKHACKGRNSCAGKGGCSSGNNGCKGKNTCKSKGGCATDGSKPKT